MWSGERIAAPWKVTAEAEKQVEVGLPRETGLDVGRQPSRYVECGQGSMALPVPAGDSGVEHQGRDDVPRGRSRRDVRVELPLRPPHRQLQVGRYVYAPQARDDAGHLRKVERPGIGSDVVARAFEGSQDVERRVLRLKHSVGNTPAVVLEVQNSRETAYRKFRIEPVGTQGRNREAEMTFL